MNIRGLLTIFGTLQIPSGAGSNKVLTSDASGNASWQLSSSAAPTAATIAKWSS